MPKSVNLAGVLKLVCSSRECDNPRSTPDLEIMSNKQQRMIVLFADVSGSARLFERLGDTEAAYAVERCVKRMDRSIAGQGGRTVNVSGGELLAAFESAVTRRVRK